MVDNGLQIVIGAGAQCWEGWTATEREELDLLSAESFAAYFGNRRADAFLCEHVWEHLTETQGRAAARLCYQYLKPGGWLRVAVPDSNFPDAAYQQTVQVGGPGPADHPAADHQIVYSAQQLQKVFESAGFEVELLEYCDEQGRFHYHSWDMTTGPIYRSLLGDHRNRAGKLGFASIVLDARRPIE